MAKNAKTLFLLSLSFFIFSIYAFEENQCEDCQDDNWRVRMDAELRAMQHEIREKDRVIGRLKEQLVLYSSEKLPDISEKNQELALKNQELSMEVVRRDDVIEHKENMCQELQARVDAVDKYHLDLASQLSSSLAKYAELERESAEMRRRADQERADLMQAMANLRSNDDIISKKMNEVEQQRMVLMEQRDHLEKDLRESKSMVADLNAGNARLEESKKAEKEKIAFMQDQVKELQETLKGKLKREEHLERQLALAHSAPKSPTVVVFDRDKDKQQVAPTTAPVPMANPMQGQVTAKEEKKEEQKAPETAVAKTGDAKKSGDVFYV